jgi:predicted transcriptional regulator
MTKSDVIEMIRRMPDDASVADIMAELGVRQQVEVGMEQAEHGETISHQDAKQKLSRWLR